MYSHIANATAGFSYTLYAVHMPLLVFCRAVLVPDAPWQPQTDKIAMAAVLCALVIAYAFVLARYTEANTERVRATLVRFFGRYASPDVNRAGAATLEVERGS